VTPGQSKHYNKTELKRQCVQYTDCLRLYIHPGVNEQHRNSQHEYKDVKISFLMFMQFKYYFWLGITSEPNT